LIISYRNQITESFIIEAFEAFGVRKILINTCLGEVFKMEDLRRWLKTEQNFCIMDHVTHDPYKNMPSTKKKESGSLKKSQERLMSQMKEYSEASHF
tara:strand:- start:600 stop:890 length:291 start_codon:yes stop_codon:yes gene_type:complete